MFRFGGIDQNKHPREISFLDELLQTLAVGKSEMAFISERDGLAFSWTTVTDDIDATDTALLICNTHQTKNLYITQVNLWTDVHAQFQIHSPAYSASFTGTAVTGVNLNRKSLEVAQAVAYADETANTQANIIETIRNNEVGTDQFEVNRNYDGAIILGYQKSIAIDIVEESGAFQATVLGYYK
jgi:hypothetical protein